MLERLSMEIVFQVLEKLNLRQLVSGLVLVNKDWNELVQHFISQLREVDLSSLQRKMPEALFHVLAKQQQENQVRVLSLERCFKTTDSALEKAVQQFGRVPLGRLRSLNLSGCFRLSDAACGSIRRSSFVTALQALVMDDCKKITSQGASALLFRIPRLEYLSLKNCPIDVEKPSDVNLSDLALPLRFLDLSGTQLTDAGLAALAPHCTLLHHVSVEECERLSDEGMAEFCQHLTSVVSLNISWTQVASNTLSAVAAHCPLLESLEAEALYDVTDAAICAVANKCSELQNLHVEQCFRLSDNILMELANCRKLRFLKIRGCHSITPAALEMFQAARPTCSVIHTKAGRIRPVVPLTPDEDDEESSSP
ncbi:Dynein regulatory complex subunit 6 [Balamuthia mandrillaris]